MCRKMSQEKQKGKLYSAEFGEFFDYLKMSDQFLANLTKHHCLQLVRAKYFELKTGLSTAFVDNRI